MISTDGGEPAFAPDNAFHLFVYGTLRSGGSASRMLDHCKRIARTSVRGTLYDVDGRFPALMLYGSCDVHGEIWRCPVELLATLDEYEGVERGMFRRVAVRVDGLACWTYVAGPALARDLTPGRRVPSGEWGPRDPR